MVVEADAFKERDVIYRALSSRGHHDDMLQTAELVCLSMNNSIYYCLNISELATVVVRDYKVVHR